MDAKKIASVGVMGAFMAMNAATSKPGGDDPPAPSAAATASAVAAAASAPPAASRAPAAAPTEMGPDVARPPNPDRSCDPKNDTTCEFNETCVGDGKKRANGTGKCVVGCPKGQAATPNGCTIPCKSDADCKHVDCLGGPCSKCKVLTQGAAARYNPPRGLACQQP